MTERPFEFYEFFAGGGMARMGLGPQWRCTFANEWSPQKAASLQNNFDGPPPVVADVHDLNASQLPGGADLAWASFPCQDLSLAGKGRGLDGERSSTFWPFWRLVEASAEAGAPIPIVVLENVVGALTSNQGQDFKTIVSTLACGGYKLGALVLDAVHFLPQSRPRLFITAVKDGVNIPSALTSGAPEPPWHSPRIIQAVDSLDNDLLQHWVWWRLPPPPERRCCLLEMLESNPRDVRWHSEQETQKILDMMSDVNLKKVQNIQAENRVAAGAVYKRTRKDSEGNKVQRAEVRFDYNSGCLRTPAGGSSRQIIMLVHGDSIRTRLLSKREAARLMGLPDHYQLPENYNEAYHLVGDGLAVPVVEWLSRRLLTPLAQTCRAIPPQAG